MFVKPFENVVLVLFSPFYIQFRAFDGLLKCPFRGTQLTFVTHNEILKLKPIEQTGYKSPVDPLCMLTAGLDKIIRKPFTVF